MEEQKFKVIIVEDVKLELKGTEEIFRDDPQVMMASIFQHPFFPYSGDVPMGPNMVNIPISGRKAHIL